MRRDSANLGAVAPPIGNRADPGYGSAAVANPSEQTVGHETLMRRALRLAWRGRGRAEPNPLVGCVIARGDETIGEGFHRCFGGPHAEIDALHDCRRRGHDPAGASAYVTLEPCCHHGKTPPCTEALIAARVARVFVAMSDPFAQVNERGIAAIRNAGIDVQVGVCEPEARRMNAPYLKRMTTGLPWVIAKWAQTLDGHIATSTGDSQWISNAASRRLVHKLRARIDAVIVGIGTVMSDDPQLTARDVRVRRVARRVLIDPMLKLPMNSKLMQSIAQHGDAAPFSIAVSEAMLRSNPPKVSELRGLGVELITLPSAMDPLLLQPLTPLLKHLVNDYGATNVLVEGGSTLLGSLFDQELVDEVIAFVAPKVLGDSTARPAVTGLQRRFIADAERLRLERIKRVGDDVMLQYLTSKDG